MTTVAAALVAAGTGSDGRPGILRREQAQWGQLKSEVGRDVQQQPGGGDQHG